MYAKNFLRITLLSMLAIASPAGCMQPKETIIIKPCDKETNAYYLSPKSREFLKQYYDMSAQFNEPCIKTIMIQNFSPSLVEDIKNKYSICPNNLEEYLQEPKYLYIPLSYLSTAKEDGIITTVKLSQLLKGEKENSDFTVFLQHKIPYRQFKGYIDKCMKQFMNTPKVCILNIKDYLWDSLSLLVEKSIAIDSNNNLCHGIKHWKFESVYLLEDEEFRSAAYVNKNLHQEIKNTLNLNDLPLNEPVINFYMGIKNIQTLIPISLLHSNIDNQNNMYFFIYRNGYSALYTFKNKTEKLRAHAKKLMARFKEEPYILSLLTEKSNTTRSTLEKALEDGLIVKKYLATSHDPEIVIQTPWNRITCLIPGTFAHGPNGWKFDKYHF